MTTDPLRPPETDEEPEYIGYLEPDEPEGSWAHYRENRHRASRIAAACLLGCAVIVLVALGRNGS